MIIFMIFTQKSVFRVDIEIFEISRNSAYVCHIPINGIIWKNMEQVLKLFLVMPKDLNLVQRLQEMNI